MKKLITILSFLFLFTTVKAQVTIVYSDPALENFILTKLNGQLTNVLIHDSIYKLKLGVRVNMDIAIPPQTIQVVIGLGTDLVLVSSAPSPYFTFYLDTNYAQQQIFSYLQNPLPGLYNGQLEFNVKAKLVNGNSWITGNLAVSNDNPNYVLSDLTPFNNIADNEYYTVLPNVPTVLPVKITSFTAQVNKCNVSVRFTTEGQADKYELQKSIDGINFEKVNEITPDNEIKFYSNENVFVRIQITEQGKKEYSNTIPVKVNCSNVSVYPNPSNGDIIIKSPKGNYKLLLINSLGQTVFTDKITTTGQLNYTIKQKGQYILLIENPGLRISKIINIF